MVQDRACKDLAHAHRIAKRWFKFFCAKRQALTFHSAPRGRRREAILALMVLWGGILIAWGCDEQGTARSEILKSDIADHPSLPLVPSESRLNLGEIRAGGQKQSDFWLMNRTASPVEVDEIETQCDCLTIEMSRRIILPDQKVQGCVVLNLRNEPHFTGSLDIEVKGKGRSGQVVFAIVVKVSVESQ